jgi:outer membrane receptor protein involved in Fe transport
VQEVQHLDATYTRIGDSLHYRLAMITEQITPPALRYMATITSCLLLVGAPLFAQDEQSEVYELSPFSVVGEDDQGYRATSTLAGSRLNTPLRDVGQSISVLTREFFDDTGATDAETALSYVMGAEVSGEQGNYSSADINGGGANSTNTTNTLRSPQNAQRIRGLARAELTRNYFLTDIPFDAYNTGRVTVSRGPNSLLFGIGSPGGVIENSLNNASLGEDFGEFSVRFGERESWRASLDYNKILVPDRLAVRVSLLDETTNFKQRPAFEDDRRVYTALQAVLLENENSEFLGRTTFRANLEFGEMEANPVNILPPGDAIKDWFNLPNPEIQNIVGVDWATADGQSVSWAVDGSFTPKWIVDNNRVEGFPRAWRTVDGSARPPYFRDVNIYFQEDGTPGIGFPEAPQVQGMQGRVHYINGQQGRTVGTRPRAELFVVKPFEGETYSTGFTIPSVMDRNIWDNQNRLFSGNLNFRDQEFDTSNFTLEQSFLDGNAGLEVAFDQQDYERETSTLLTTGRFNALTIDPNGYLNYPGPNPDLSAGPADFANPNAGRPVAVIGGQSGGDRGDELHYFTNREAFRATGFYNLDFTQHDGVSKWFGRHILSAFYNDQEIESVTRNVEGYYVGVTNQINGCIEPCGPGFAQQYLAPSMLGSEITKPGDIHVDRGVFLPPFGGASYQAAYWDEANNVWEVGTVTESQALNGGSRQLDSFQSEVYSVQSYLLNNNLVGLVGWRKDSIQNYSVSAGSFPRDSAGNRPEPAGLELARQDPLPDVDSFTWSVVGHSPWEIGGADVSVHYSESENFQPTGLRRDAFGEVVGSPQGTTKEYGVSFQLFDGKVSVRTNWFETISSLNAVSVGGAVNGGLGVVVLALNEWQDVADGLELDNNGMPYTIDLALSPLVDGGLQDSQLDFSGQWASFDELLGDIFDTIPAAVQDNAQVGIDPSTGDWAIRGDYSNLVATQDVAADGFEMEVVANILSDNWRVGFNISQQETVTSNTALSQGEVVSQIAANIDAAGLTDLRDRPVSTTGFVFDSTFFRSAELPLANARAKDNTVVQELVEWRWNVFTNYQFSQDSFLNGFGIGGALRWQDKIATGYELINVNGSLVSDVSKPFFGKDDLAGDTWVSYRGKLNNKIDYRLQLNIRNLIGEDDYILIATNPDGSPAVVRNPNPTEVFLTSTFSF